MLFEWPYVISSFMSEGSIIEDEGFAFSGRFCLS